MRSHKCPSAVCISLLLVSCVLSVSISMSGCCLSISTCGLCVSVVLLCVTVSICLASVQMSVCCLFLMTPAYAPAWLCCTSDFSSLGLLSRAGQEGQVWSTSQGFPLGCVVSHIQCNARSVHSRYADVRGDLSTIAWHTGHVVFPQYIDNLTCETATISQLVTAQSTGETITISNSLKHTDDLTCETTAMNQLVTAWSSGETITISNSLKHIDDLICETTTMNQLETAWSTGETITISNSLKPTDNLTCETTTINDNLKHADDLACETASSTTA